MPKPVKEPVEKVCELDTCGKTFRTKYPNRQKYCPGSKCRSEAFNRTHRVADPEAFARDVLRAHWRAEWRRNGQARRARKRAKRAGAG